jgi:hypothetical protein
MSNQIQLEWSVSATDSSFSPAQAAAALGAVVLYTDPVTDPVLGQGFGLTVASDTTAVAGGGATRTILLNMNPAAGAPHAPPPFPCHPTTPTPPVLPYEIGKTIPLSGGFTVNNGSAAIATEVSQIPSLNVGDTVQFNSQLGVDYTVLTVSPLVLTASYSGNFANTTAVKVVTDPAKLPALYSTSMLDDAGGSGARTISVSYLDSLGVAATVVTSLSGKRPVQLVLGGGTIDVATITAMSVATTGAFDNSVGQITLCELSAPILNVSGGIQDTDDEAQMKIARRLVYLPQSYFSLSQQNVSAPQLDGDFSVNPDSIDVFTTVDQTGGAVQAGDFLQFASQPGALYEVASVTPKIVTLTGRYQGFVPAVTGAMKLGAATVPTDAQLSVLLARYVNPGNAIPPPGAPLSPETMAPSPIVLSDLYTQTISIALAVPVTSSVIALV